MNTIIFGILMAIAIYFSEKFTTKFSEHHVRMLSLSAGISITYIFLDLFPQFNASVIATDQRLFLSVLVGFVLLHLVEKHIYQHTSKDVRKRELALADSSISFIYHFIIGMLIVYLTNQSAVSGVLFFLPILFYSTLSTLPVDPTSDTTVRLILSSSTLLGILFATYLATDISPVVNFSLLGLVIGVLLYTTIRHGIPQGKAGKPVYFVLGVMFYALLIFLTRGF
ncbi:MAG: hypothetical protein QF632_06995 [Candidatus Woesearchaeota archaeon]|jgi:hypothetical protein|nr:hypothetical protein [Candidatus Woesearchaeota archaeon]MDP7457300.1 hypothetical protein [Candidatus Woesearchaeota archaeon]